MRYFNLILLTVVIALTNAQKRTCSEPAIFKNFNIESILGHWYKYSSRNHEFEAGCDCLTYEFNAINATNIQASTCCQMTGVSNETQTCGFGITLGIHTGSDTKEATFKYTIAGSTIESHAWIIDTDYDNYLIANGCDHISDDEVREAFWILSRDKELNEDEVLKINQVLNDNNVEKSKIIKQRHGVDLCTAKLPANARKNLHHRRHKSHDGI